MLKPTLALVSSLLLLGAAAVSAEESTYEIDPVHSIVFAKATHAGVSTAWIRFNKTTGKVTFNDADPSKSSVMIEVQAESVDSANEKRDQHLKSPDFLNAKQFGTITFKSTTVAKKGDKEYDITGDLTVRGVTKSVTTTFKVVGIGKSPKGDAIAGGDCSFKVKRSDFGVTFGPGALSDEVELLVSVEAGKK